MFESITDRKTQISRDAQNVCAITIVGTTLNMNEKIRTREKSPDNQIVPIIEVQMIEVWLYILKSFLNHKHSLHLEQGWLGGESSPFHQCGLGSIPRLSVISGLKLLVLYSVLRGFSPVLPFSALTKKQNLISCDSVWFVVSSII